MQRCGDEQAEKDTMCHLHGGNGGIVISGIPGSWYGSMFMFQLFSIAFFSKQQILEFNT